MGRRTVVVAVAALAAGGFGASSVDGRQPAPAPPGFTERTLGFTEGEGRPTLVVDVPPRGAQRGRLSAGDTWVFTKPLRGDTGPAGNVRARCVGLSSGRNPRAMCDAVIELADGTLTLVETFRFNDRERTAAITGGTSAYAGATGTYRGGGDLGNRDEIRVLLP
jgi:hypothetical protein